MKPKPESTRIIAQKMTSPLQWTFQMTAKANMLYMIPSQSKEKPQIFTLYRPTASSYLNPYLINARTND
jgi:hypothetical protein